MATTGITPAGAGKTLLLRFYVSASRDHPRRCGENFFACRNDGFARGSPPQVRGKHAATKNVGQPTGITPAGAGKTIKIIHFTFRTWDHPRRCGENSHAIKARLFPPGSPPQVRGKLVNVAQIKTNQRITPAGAGKTFRIPLAVRPSKDHPRRCGENFLLAPFSRINLGSPPQVRGKLGG